MNKAEFDKLVDELTDKNIIQRDFIDIHKLLKLKSENEIYRDNILQFMIILLSNNINLFNYVGKEIPAGMFYNSLTGPRLDLPILIIPENVEIIGRNAFLRCNIREIVFSNSLTKIEDQAFYKSSIEHIDLSNTKCKVIDSLAFCECTDVKDIQLPDTLEKLGALAFNLIKSDQVTSINFPKSLKIIDKYCFSNCSFTKLEFNDGLEYIGQNAFRANRSLTEVILSTTLNDETLDRIAYYDSVDYIFTDCNKLKTIYSKSESQYDYLMSHQPVHKNDADFHIPNIVLIK